MARGKKTESVMVVHRDDMFQGGEWIGLNTEFFRLLEIVRLRYTFMPRWGENGVEEDPQWLQIIPFGVLTSQGRIFSFVKSTGSSEKRLHGEWFIGVGGHLQQLDVTSYGSLLSWFQREWFEEVEYSGHPFVFPVGVVYDPSRPVGAVHLGFTFLLYGDELSIRVKAHDELILGKWLSIEELDRIHVEDRERGKPGLAPWCIVILEHLRKHRTLLAL
jgi:predicted NUDIX family phosphoesterase